MTNSGSGSNESFGFFLHRREEEEPTLKLGLDNAAEYAHMQYLYHHNHNHQHHQPQIYGRDFKRNSRSERKKSARGPRMKWTDTLRAHFIHAVELLGGHDSTFILIYLSVCMYVLMYTWLYMLCIVCLYFRGNP